MCRGSVLISKGEPGTYVCGYTVGKRRRGSRPCNFATGENFLPYKCICFGSFRSAEYSMKIHCIKVKFQRWPARVNF